MRTDDGSEPSEVNYYLGRYERRTDSLRWRPTGPFYSARPGPAFASFDRCLYPGHGYITPWTMTSGSQFRAPDFHDPASPVFAEEFDTIRRLGGADSAIRTADQSEIALFWEDGPWGITPPGHFIYIAMQLLQDRRPELHRARPGLRPDRHDAVRCFHLRVGQQVPSRYPPTRKRHSRACAGVRQPGPASRPATRLAQPYSDPGIPRVSVGPFHVWRRRGRDDRADPWPGRCFVLGPVAQMGCCGLSWQASPGAGPV